MTSRRPVRPARPVPLAGGTGVPRPVGNRGVWGDFRAMCDHTSSAASVGQAAPTPSDTTVAGGGGTAGPAVPRVDVVLPLHLAPVGNRREHWRSRARRTSREIAAVLGALEGHPPPAPPVVIELTRTGWNRLDPADGLCGAVKAPIDALAAWLGLDDRDRRLYWRLAQSVTRETRLVHTGRGLRREAAASLRIVVRPWQPSDGDDPLRVLAEAPAVLP